MRRKKGVPIHNDKNVSENKYPQIKNGNPTKTCFFSKYFHIKPGIQIRSNCLLHMYQDGLRINKRLFCLQHMCQDGLKINKRLFRFTFCGQSMLQLMGYLRKVKGYISLDLFLIKFIETCVTKSVDTSKANSNCFLREADRRCAQERLLRLDFYHTMPTSKQKPVHLLF